MRASRDHPLQRVSLHARSGIRPIAVAVIAVAALVLTYGLVPKWLVSDDPFSFLTPADRARELSQARWAVLAATAGTLALGIWWNLQPTADKRGASRSRRRAVVLVGVTAVAWALLMLVALKIAPRWLASSGPYLRPSERIQEIGQARWSILALLAASIASTIGLYHVRQRHAVDDESLEYRISELTGSLNSAAHTVLQIQLEVESRQHAIERIRQEHTAARQELETEMNLLELSRDEAAAVRQAFRREFGA